MRYFEWNDMAKQQSDLKRAFSEDGALKTHIGGQALLEGIMMRGKFNWAAAIRSPDGSIYVEEHDLASGKEKNKWMTWPLVRGCVALVESLGLGFKALSVATDHAFDRYDMSYAMYLEEGLDPAKATPEERMRAAGWNDDEIAEQLQTEAAEGAAEGADAEGPSSSDEEEKKFSWKDDFGNPEEMIDALGAQRNLEVVSEAPSNEVAADSKNPKEADECVLAAETADNGAASAQADQEKRSDSPAKAKDGGLPEGVMSVSMVLGVVLGIVLFIVAPAAVTNLIVGEYDSNFILWNVVDGILRVAIFVLYLWLIGRMKDIKRMFSYHGAEHKTIHCFEHGLPLTPENCRSFPRLHVRCGTAFLIMVMILAILVYTIIPVNMLISAWGVPDGAPKLVLVILVRIIFMPVIAGLSYEINVKWAGTHPDNPLVKVILWPGMQMQYLTTNEPDDSMLECAIAATKKILEREDREAVRAS